MVIIRVITSSVTSYVIPDIRREGAEGALVREFLLVVHIVPFKFFTLHGGVFTVRTLVEDFIRFFTRWRWKSSLGFRMRPPNVQHHIVSSRLVIAIAAVNVFRTSAISVIKPLFFFISVYFIQIHCIVFHLIVNFCH